MSWTERQRSMLQAMGLRVWAPPSAIGQTTAEQEEAEVPTAAASAFATSHASAGPGALAPIDKASRNSRNSNSGPAGDSETLKPHQVGNIADKDWPALREAVVACTACGLCQTRRQTVFGAGSTQAHWMVVGEAPGHQEDQRGEPFIGPSGQLLDRMLAALQLSRDDDPERPAAQRVFITNALKCHPPRDRNPTSEELSKCLPFLRRQVELLQPRLILALGGAAAKALLGSEEPVGQLRGRVHSFAGAPLIVSYHPAYLLRQPLEKAKAWQDLCLAKATMPD